MLKTNFYNTNYEYSTPEAFSSFNFISDLDLYFGSLPSINNKFQLFSIIFSLVIFCILI